MRLLRSCQRDSNLFRRALAVFIGAGSSSLVCFVWTRSSPTGQRYYMKDRRRSRLVICGREGQSTSINGGEQARSGAAIALLTLSTKRKKAVDLMRLIFENSSLPRVQFGAGVVHWGQAHPRSSPRFSPVRHAIGTWSKSPQHFEGLPVRRVARKRSIPLTAKRRQTI